MRVDVTLQATKESVVVFFPGLANNIFGPLILRNIDTDKVSILESTIAGFVENDLDTIDSVPITRTMVLKLTQASLPEGEYEIIPYLLPRNRGIPALLTESLGERVESLGESYLNMPFGREGDHRFLRIATE